LAACAALLGCARSEIPETKDASPDSPEDAPTDADGGVVVTRANKVDLLFVVDNTADLDVPQLLLSKTLPYLFHRLTSPACVNGLGNVVTETASPKDPCPKDMGEREFAPLTDIHVGVITTSLGGHGADICSPSGPGWNALQNDMGHLVARDGLGGMVATY